MTASMTKTSGTAGGDEPARVLRLLARKSLVGGVTATPAPEGIELGGLSNGVHQRIALIALETWLLWRSKAWISCDAEISAGTRTWHLTARGRQQVRRQIMADQLIAAAGSQTSPGPMHRTPVSRHQPGSRRARETTPPTSTRPLPNPSESPIGWLATRRDKNGVPMISAEQLNAAERLRADYWFAGMSPRVTTNWSAALAGGGSGRPTGGVDMTDSVLAANTRVRHAVVAVGPELASLLIDVCCHLKGLEDAERKAGWPLRSAKVVLQLALTRLARHYGLLPPGGEPARMDVRHWGADNYRPGISDGA